jgi:hypothetical protein
MKNIMLDLETMGVGSDAAIVSIGAVVFDPENDLLGETFYINVDLSSCLENGLSVTGATINWWLKQSDSAREALFENPVSLKDALTLFSEYVHKFEKPRVWGNGSGFDNEILKNAYKAAKLECPWEYYNDRDLRTLVDIGRSIVGKQSYEAIGTKHNALDDAINQAKLASKYWQLLSHKSVNKS